jgi:alpha-tubulin suppressor-like RCC1 family protein
VHRSKHELSRSSAALIAAGSVASAVLVASDAAAQSVGSGGPQGFTGFIAPGQAAAKVHGGGQNLAVKTSDGRHVIWGKQGLHLPAAPGAVTSPSASNPVAKLCTSNWNNLALMQDGTLLEWGHSYEGQPYAMPAGGVGSPTNKPVDIAMFDACRAAILQDRSLVMWGNNANGQANVPAGLGAVAEVSLGVQHALVRLASGVTRAWGAGTTNPGSWPNYGQSMVPAELAAAGSTSLVCAGGYHSIALMSNGQMRGWGYNQYGQTQVAGLTGVVQVAAGTYHTVVRRSNGVVICLGAGNQVADLGFPNHTQSNVPQGIGVSPNRVVDIAAADASTIVLLEDGSVRMWGVANQGPVGGIPKATAASSAPIESLDGDSRWFVGVRTDGTMLVAGYDAISNGYVTQSTHSLPAGTTVAGNRIMEVHVSPVTNTAIARRQDGAVFVWGNTTFGQAQLPSDVGLAANPPVSVSIGYGHCAAVLADGTLRAWGLNTSYEATVPTGLGTPSNPAVQVACGGDGTRGHTVVRMQDGRVSCFGSNSHGQISPPSWLGLTGAVVDVDAGGRHGVALIEDGVVVCWGDNNRGQTLVPNAALDASNPVQAVCAGLEHTVALRQDGTVVAWGREYEGQLSPVVPTGHRVTRIAAGGNATFVATEPAGADCDGDGISDGPSDDSDADGRPDACERAAGDLNLDGAVDGSDLGLMLSLWGTPNPASGDFNGDGAVDGADLGIMLSKWGPVP